LRLFPVILTLVLSTVVLAEPPVIYKSVDEQGRVTYSSEPVQDAVKVEEVQTAPAPPVQETDNARDRTESMMDMANELEQGRLEKEKLRTEQQLQQQRLAQQQAQLEQQQKLLEEMQQYNNGWAGGIYWPYPPAGQPFPRPPMKPRPPKPTPLPEPPVSQPRPFTPGGVGIPATR
jgi:hypothetical protein